MTTEQLQSIESVRSIIGTKVWFIKKMRHNVYDTCKKCGGVGSIHVAGVKYDCTSCHGRKKKSLGMRVRYQVVETEVKGIIVGTYPQNDLIITTFENPNWEYEQGDHLIYAWPIDAREVRYSKEEAIDEANRLNNRGKRK